MVISTITAAPQCNQTPKKTVASDRIAKVSPESSKRIKNAVLPKTGLTMQHPSVFEPLSSQPKALVISVCDGISMLLDAVEAFTGNIWAHTCERDKKNLRDFVAARWPSEALVTQTADIRSMPIAKIKKDIELNRPDFIILGGGPPCQPFSGLASNPKGSEDERSAPIQVFKKIRDSLCQFCEDLGIPFLWMMEEAASMSRQHRDAISE